MYWAILILLVVIAYFIIKMVRGSIKHSAVQNAFLAKYTFTTINNQDQERVENKTIEILMRGGPLSTEYKDWIMKTYKDMSEFQKFSVMALTMAELNIQPGLPNETWHYVKKPFQALETAEHQVKVCQSHFIKKHNVHIDLR